MAPSNGTNIASFPVESESTSSPSRPAQVNQDQGSLPIANIIILAISIIGMGGLVLCVFLRHRSSARMKQSSSKVNKDEPRPFNRLRSRALSLFSKPHLWRSKTKSATTHKEGDMTTVGALHATCTFVAAAPSKVLAPPVVMQFRIPDTEKFVVLCSVRCPLSTHHACGDPMPWGQNTFADIPHLAREQLPVNNRPSGIPDREHQPYSVDIPPSDQGLSPTIELPALSFEDRSRSRSAPPNGPRRMLTREDLPVLFVKTPPR